MGTSREKYEAHFQSAKERMLRGEASVSYLYSPVIAKHIRDGVPDTWLVYSDAAEARTRRRNVQLTKREHDANQKTLREPNRRGAIPRGVRSRSLKRKSLFVTATNEADEKTPPAVGDTKARTSPNVVSASLKIPSSLTGPFI